MSNSRYEGERGTENFLDDYVFGPMFLLVILMVGALAGHFLAGDIGAVVGFLIGLVIDIQLVRAEWRLRREA